MKDFSVFVKLGLALPFSFIICASTWAQKKPTLMILPSDNWCIEHNYCMTYDNQGVQVRIPNYQQAFQEDIELNTVISKVGEVMTGFGYSLKDASWELKNISTRTAEDNVTYSKSSGDRLSESSLDALKRKAKADIIIQVGWSTTRITAGRNVHFIVEAFDAYTSKRIATVVGNHDASSQTIANTLQQAIKMQIKPFDKQLDNFYSKMKSKGRETLLTIRRWENWNHDLETEYGGEELLTIIQRWLSENTVNGQFSLMDSTDDMAQFEQVMIPLKDAQNVEVDARSFAHGLQRYLKNQYDITSKLMMRGLGEAILVLGEK